MSATKKWAIQNTVYLDATTYEEAVKKFWQLMEKGGVSVLTHGAELPNCFVSEVEKVDQKGNPL